VRVGCRGFVRPSSINLRVRVVMPVFRSTRVRVIPRAVRRAMNWAPQSGSSSIPGRYRRAEVRARKSPAGAGLSGKDFR